MLVRESIPRQIDKKFRVPKEENGVWGLQGGGKDIGFSLSLFLISAFLSLSHIKCFFL